MSVISAPAFADILLTLPKTAVKADGVRNFVEKVGNFMDQLQAGPTGSPGIFKLNRPAMIALLMTQSPVDDDSWIDVFANAWQAGVAGAVITPGTVTDPAWIGSGGVDAVTLGIGSAVITNIPAAKAKLISKLKNVKPVNAAPIPMAEAIRDATKTMQFTCIGLGPPPPLTPIPKVFTAQ